jgi:hypothetical protein
MLAFRSMTNTENAVQMQGIVLNEITLVMSLMSGFGSCWQRGLPPIRSPVK